MKRKILLTFVLLLLSIYANSQTKTNSFRVGGGTNYSNKGQVFGLYFFNEYSKTLFSPQFSISLKFQHVFSESNDSYLDKPGYRNSLTSGRVSWFITDNMNVSSVHEFKSIKPDVQSHYIANLGANYTKENKYTVWRVGTGISFGYLTQKYVYTVSYGKLDNTRDVVIHYIHSLRILDLGMDFTTDYAFRVNKNSLLGLNFNMAYFFKSNYSLYNASLFYQFTF